MISNIYRQASVISTHTRNNDKVFAMKKILFTIVIGIIIILNSHAEASKVKIKTKGDNFLILKEKRKYLGTLNPKLWI